MSLVFYGHPFSSYTQKVLMALYENETPFEYRNLDPAFPENGEEHRRLWPIKRFPVLADGETPVFESSIVIEYLDIHHRGRTRFLPADPDRALHVRMMDRFFDNYVMGPMQQVVFGRIHGNAEAFKTFEMPNELVTRAYAWLDKVMATREWAAGDAISMADCAAAPSLFYADWIEPIPAEYANVRAYRARLLAHPSFARCVEEARPYRHYFPGGAPDQD